MPLKKANQFIGQILLFEKICIRQEYLKPKNCVQANHYNC